MKGLSFNKNLCDSWVGELGPKIRKKLYINKEENQNCSIIWIGAKGYEILYYEDTYVVKL